MREGLNSKAAKRPGEMRFAVGDIPNISAAAPGINWYFNHRRELPGHVDREAKTCSTAMLAKLQDDTLLPVNPNSQQAKISAPGHCILKNLAAEFVHPASCLCL